MTPCVFSPSGLATAPDALVSRRSAWCPWPPPLSSRSLHPLLNPIHTGARSAAAAPRAGALPSTPPSPLPPPPPPPPPPLLRRRHPPRRLHRRRLPTNPVARCWAASRIRRRGRSTTAAASPSACRRPSTTSWSPRTTMPGRLTTATRPSPGRTPLASHLQIGSRDELESVVIKPSNQLKITFLEAKDITDLGTLKEASKIFVPAGAKVYSARTIKVKDEEDIRTYYFYEFGLNIQHVALMATVNSGKTYIAAVTAPQTKWEDDGVKLRSAAVSLSVS